MEAYKGSGKERESRCLTVWALTFTLWDHSMDFHRFITFYMMLQALFYWKNRNIEQRSGVMANWPTEEGKSELRLLNWEIYKDMSWSHDGDVSSIAIDDLYFLIDLCWTICRGNSRLHNSTSYLWVHVRHFIIFVILILQHSFSSRNS